MERRSIPAGLLGRYYSARHIYGHYRSCGVTGRYIISLEQDLRSLLRYALARNIARHPALCYSITAEKLGSLAQLIRLESIEFNDVVEFNKSSLAAGNEDTLLAKHIGRAHEHVWSDPNKPIWKLIVFTHERGSLAKTRVVDLAFITHHAISDGLSAAAFHKSLLEYLTEAGSAIGQESIWPCVIPSDLPKPRNIEDILSYTAAPTEARQAASPSITKSITLRILPTNPDFVSCVSILSIPESLVPGILVYCRDIGTSLTGLLHALFAIYLSRVFPSQTLTAITPYSLRSWTSLPLTEMANHVSYIRNIWSPLDSTRSFSSANNPTSTPGSAAIEDTIIKVITTKYHEEITSELQQVNSRGPLILNAISSIPNLDFTQYCESNIGASNSATYEISNLGVVTAPSLSAIDIENEAVKLEKLVFTQSAMVAGPALGVGVASLANGPLVISFYWEEGVLTTDLVDGLKTYIEEKFGRLGKLK
ncbi:alcohol acetyltransferase [Bisporella sp. PMI_857]|nr:alcohol acetyltransferase [Bisporella sp. PMI_857]